MSLGAYLKSSVWEFALLLVSCWCLGVVIMDGFYVDEWLQFGAAPLLSTAVLLLALYLAAWRHDRMPVGIVATVVVVAVLVGGSMALSTAGSSYDDVFGNYLWAAVVVVLCTLAGFALTRTLAGAGAWFVVCIFLCSLVQALFETGRVGFPFAVLVTALAMVVYRNFRIGAAKADSLSGVSFFANFVTALVPIVALAGLGCALWFGIIAPLNPGVLYIELVTEYRTQDVKQVRGVGNVQMGVDTSMTSDQLVDGEMFTTDDLRVDPNADKVVEARSRQVTGLQTDAVGDESGGTDASGQSGGNREKLDKKSTEEKWHAISYTLQQPWLWLVLLGLGLVIVGIVAYFFLRRWYREKRLERFIVGKEEREQVSSLYLFLIGKFPQLGFSVPAGTTLSTFAHVSAYRMEALETETKVPFEKLTDTYTKVAYGGYEPTEEDIAPFVAYYEGFWKAARKQLGNVRYFFKSFRLG